VCWRRLSPCRLRTQVGRVAFKRRVTPLDGNHVFHSMCRVLPPSEPPDGERSRRFRLAVVGGTQLRGSWYLSAIARLQGFSSGSSAASPCSASSLMVGRSKPGCGLCPALSFKDVHHQCWGGECAELGPVSARTAARSFPQRSGGGGRSPFVALAAAACLALRPERLRRCFRCHLPPRRPEEVSLPTR
jgi:hypothetical protein